MPGDVVYGGYRPGAIGAVVALHGAYYGKVWGFGPNFEGAVASGLAAFLKDYDPSRDLFLTAYDDDALLGSITISGASPPDGEAHLRWFIMAGTARGRGIGSHLLSRALAFSDNCGFDPLSLLTFAGLDAARALYERHGFVMTQEGMPDPWGADITTQRFVRPHGDGMAGRIG